MKETDIVQALRCCAEGECKDCAMHEDTQRCQENLLDKAAEAIERLTAENAALREKVPLTEDAMINLAAQALGVEPIRLRELAEADKDGRVIILPCKVYETDGVRVYEHTVREVIYETAGGPAFDKNAIGKRTFLTRAEAERAIQETEGKKDG